MNSNNLESIRFNLPWDIHPKVRNDRKSTILGLVTQLLTHPHHIPYVLRIGLLSKTCFQVIENSSIWKSHAEQIRRQDIPQEIKWKGDIESLTARDFVDQLASQKIEGSKDFTASDYKSYFLLRNANPFSRIAEKRIYSGQRRCLGDGEFIKYYTQPGYYTQPDLEASATAPFLIEIESETPGQCLRFQGSVEVDGKRHIIPHFDEALPFGKRSFWGINVEGWYQFTLPAKNGLSYDGEPCLEAERFIPWDKILHQGASRILEVYERDDNSTYDVVSALFEIVGDSCLMYGVRDPDCAVQFNLSDPTNHPQEFSPSKGAEDLYLDSAFALEGGFAVIYKSHPDHRPPVPIKRLVFWPCGRSTPLPHIDISDPVDESNEVKEVYLTPDRQKLILAYCSKQGDDQKLTTIAMRIVNLNGENIVTADDHRTVYRLTAELRQLINQPTFVCIVNESTMLYFNHCTRTYIDFTKQKYLFEKICDCTADLRKGPHDYAITRHSMNSILIANRRADSDKMSLDLVKITHSPAEWKDINTLVSDILYRHVIPQQLSWEDMFDRFTYYSNNLTLHTNFSDGNSKKYKTVFIPRVNVRGLSVDQLRAKRIQRLIKSRQETIKSQQMNLSSQPSVSSDSQERLDLPNKRQKNT